MEGGGSTSSRDAFISFYCLVLNTGLIDATVKAFPHLHSAGTFIRHYLPAVRVLRAFLHGYSPSASSNQLLFMIKGGASAVGVKRDKG